MFGKKRIYGVTHCSVQCLGEDGICGGVVEKWGDGEVGEMEEQSTACAVERGRTASMSAAELPQRSCCYARHESRSSCVHVPAAAGGHLDVCGLCYHQRAFGCPWFVLLPEAMLMSVGRDDDRDLAGVCGLCCH